MTEGDLIKAAEEFLEAVAEHLRNNKTSLPVETVLLASIACSNIAIYKASR